MDDIVAKTEKTGTVEIDNTDKTIVDNIGLGVVRALAELDETSAPRSERSANSLSLSAGRAASTRSDGDETRAKWQSARAH